MAGFLGAAGSFRHAVLQHDEDGQERELRQLRREFADAPDDDLQWGGSMLADVLHSVPVGRAADVATVIGACVERGADAADCAEPVLFRAQLAMEGAAEFCRRWPEREGDPYPEPMGEFPPSRLYWRLGGADDPEARAAVLGWWNLPVWEAAVAAVLWDKEVRKALLPRKEFYEVARQVVAITGRGTTMTRALALLDDEPLVVIYRPSLQAFELKMSGIADNFQLHTLLADRLVSPGHIPGEPPSAETVEACLGVDPGAPIQYAGSAWFHLVAPNGTSIPNDGCPNDIPVVDNHRLLILDPPPPDESWSVSVPFPDIAAELTVERRLSEDGVKHWMACTEPAEVTYPEAPADPAEAAESEKHHWWQRSPAHAE